jgi:hypothetical protein
MTTPRIRRLVMYKHGIAFVERRGAAQGPFELSFAKDEMSEILKSFVAWVEKGDGSVGWVGFEKPDDAAATLAAKNLALDPNYTLTTLLANLTGRRVKLVSAHKEVEGAYVGLQTEHAAHGAVAPRAILHEDGRLTLVPVNEVVSVQLVEEHSKANVLFYLDRSRSANAGEQKLIRVEAKGNCEEIGVSYIVPAPTWRVSYRLIVEDETLLLLGWGIVHNPLSEDIENCELTLTTGRPNSFSIDLYNPQEVVREVRREAPVPKLERSRSQKMSSTGGAPPPPMASVAAAPRSSMRTAMFAMNDEDEAPALDHARSMDAGLSQNAVMSARGEHFEYRVAQAVSMRNGGSAMVPLFSRRMPVKKERTWSVNANSWHPDIVLRFKNETEAVLEQGPAVIYEQSTYAGEAMLAFQAPGSDVAVPFAKDPAVTCRSHTMTFQVVTRVYIANGALLQENAIELRHYLSLSNKSSKEVSVLFLVPRHRPDAEILQDGQRAVPETTTTDGFEVRLTASAQKEAEAIFSVRWKDSEHVYWEGVTGARLQEWLSSHFLDAQTIAELESVITLREQAEKVEQVIAQMDAPRQEWTNREARLRGQLEVLRDGGAEGEMRLRVIRDLEESHRALDQLQQEERTLSTKVTELREQAERELVRILTRKRETDAE